MAFRKVASRYTSRHATVSINDLGEYRVYFSKGAEKYVERGQRYMVHVDTDAGLAAITKDDEGFKLPGSRNMAPGLGVSLEEAGVIPGQYDLIDPTDDAPEGTVVCFRFGEECDE